MFAAVLLGSLTLVPASRGADPEGNSDDKVAKRTAQFPKLDKNADGSLTKEEFLDRKALKENPDAAEKAAKAFAKFDTDGDGALSKDEFVQGGQKGGKAKGAGSDESGE